MAVGVDGEGRVSAAMATSDDSVVKPCSHSECRSATAVGARGGDGTIDFCMSRSLWAKGGGQEKRWSALPKLGRPTHSPPRHLSCLQRAAPRLPRALAIFAGSSRPASCPRPCVSRSSAGTLGNDIRAICARFGTTEEEEHGDEEDDENLREDEGEDEVRAMRTTGGQARGRRRGRGEARATRARAVVGRLLPKSPRGCRARAGQRRPCVCVTVLRCAAARYFERRDPSLRRAMGQTPCTARHRPSDALGDDGWPVRCRPIEGSRSQTSAALQVRCAERRAHRAPAARRRARPDPPDRPGVVAG